jgi:hypothetical protein
MPSRQSSSIFVEQMEILMKYIPAIALVLGLATLTAEASPAAAAMSSPRLGAVAQANPALEKVYWEYRHWHHWHHPHYWYRHEYWHHHYWHHHGYGY